MNKTPLRGFSKQEYQQRLADIQARMEEAKMDAIALTTAADIRYFSGFVTQFWHSPTRPWFLIIPANGEMVAVIPDIGVSGMAATHVTDIRHWSSPRPDDEGISILADLLTTLGKRHKKIGMPLGSESVLRMPISDWLKLREQIAPLAIVDCAGLLQQQRMIKSPAEIEKIKYIAGIVSDAFINLPSQAAAGMSERDLCRLMRLTMIQNGADESPYLIGIADIDGYNNVIMGPTDRIPRAGEIFMIDTGAVYDGYFCDFDRNFGIEHTSAIARAGHKILTQALNAGFAAARPGATAADVWKAMRQHIPAAGNIGRMGHGIGMQLTEPPSIKQDDNTVLQTGMTLALEPSMPIERGRLMVCEENIVITDNGAKWLSRPIGEEILLLK